jgi:hypothetical protein
MRLAGYKAIRLGGLKASYHFLAFKLYSSQLYGSLTSQLPGRYILKPINLVNQSTQSTYLTLSYELSAIS